MEAFVSLVLTLGAALVAVPVVILSIEIAAAIVRPLRSRPLALVPECLDRRIAVLVPAHNESSGLLPTLSDIKKQLRPGDRIVVIADNCSDDTAGHAAAAGAEVIERHDPMRRGKGYALDFGLQCLDVNPPHIVIVVDADCRLSVEATHNLASICAATGRPVQALDLMTAPVDSTINYQVAEFAWRVKNWVRPSGLAALGLPCQLMGTGMAFPWEAIRSVNLATGSIVEDLKLGLDLASKGYAPIFCPSARVTSQFAQTAGAARTQRERWERGHLSTIVTIFPRLFVKSLVSRNWPLLVLALDLAVPPLSLLVVLTAGAFVAAAACRLLGLPSPALSVSVSTIGLFVLVLGAAWLKYGRDILGPRSIPLIITYVLTKLNLYRPRFAAVETAKWIKTDRTKAK